MTDPTEQLEAAEEESRLHTGEVERNLAAILQPFRHAASRPTVFVRRGTDGAQRQLELTIAFVRSPRAR